MIVEHFYCGMIEADEKYVLSLMFQIFLDGKWSYKLVRVGWFKVCHVMQNQTQNNCRGKTCVWHFFTWYQKVTDAGHYLELMRLHSCITLTLISRTIVLYCFMEILHNFCQ